ncbi:MAG: hypothetical protein HUK40_01790 [Desulfobacter sp.]|nr:hypothetical protein [Desulfobacter sp.]
MIQSYFKHPDPGTDEQIRALTWFLENGDFPELRTALTGISRAVLNFSKNPHGVEIKTEGGPLKMIWKNLPGSGW